MRVLFWNTHKNNSINQTLVELIIENRVSIVILAEYTANINELIDFLAIFGMRFQENITIGCERIHILSNNTKMEPGPQNKYYSMQIIDDNIILCSVHLNSKIYSENQADRVTIIGELKEDLSSIENDRKISNTAIVGDFNANPYENEFIEANHLHSLPVYSDTARGSRVVKNKTFNMFYNPMWNFFGDFKKPYGTYYHRGSTALCTFWNIYDQVIISPALRKRFIDNELKIITETKTKFLLDSKDHPNKKISDHLPIIFEIMEENHGQET